jgi:hypothetical protein
MPRHVSTLLIALRLLAAPLGAEAQQAGTGPKTGVVLSHRTWTRVLFLAVAGGGIYALWSAFKTGEISGPGEYMYGSYRRSRHPVTFWFFVTAWVLITAMGLTLALWPYRLP